MLKLFENWKVAEKAVRRHKLEFTGRDSKADKLVRKQSDLRDVIKKKRKRNEIEKQLSKWGNTWIEEVLC